MFRTMFVPAKLSSNLKRIFPPAVLSQLQPSCRHSLFRPCSFLHPSPISGSEDPEKQSESDSQMADRVHQVLREHRDGPTKKLELALAQFFDSKPTEELVLDVMRRNRSDCKIALKFFNWISSTSPLSAGPAVCNEILDILGKMRQFEDADKVFDEMSKRKGFVSEETYRVLVNRYAAAHKVDEAVGMFRKRSEFGLEEDEAASAAAFQRLLISLCRYKHVEDAETLLHSRENGVVVGHDIKTLNIVLNGWCVLGNVREAKRFWKDIIASKCKPDLFTYATFINALTKKGKLGTALKLYRAMRKSECKPDVVVCNCVIDALCFKKRIPEALEIFREMNDDGGACCSPNVATYNSLIKHLCRIRRMEKVHELLDEMEEKRGSCLPNDVTFNYLLKSLKDPGEVRGILERMERNGCSINQDTYNLMLKMYVNWDCEEKVREVWCEMENKGSGPDQRSYSIMVHWLYQKGRFDDALRYFREMKSKGMVPEPQTEMLVGSISTKQGENKTIQKKRLGTNQKKLSIKRIIERGAVRSVSLSTSGSNFSKIGGQGGSC